MNFSDKTWNIIRKTTLVLVFISVVVPASFKGAGFCYGKYVDYQLEKYCKQLTVKHIKKSLSTRELFSLEDSEREVNLLNDERRDAVLHRCADAKNCVSFIRLFRGNFPNIDDLKTAAVTYYISAYRLSIGAYQLRLLGEGFSKKMEKLESGFSKYNY
jgi:hypothetical protein